MSQWLENTPANIDPKNPVEMTMKETTAERSQPDKHTPIRPAAGIRVAKKNELFYFFFIIFFTLCVTLGVAGTREETVF